MQTTSPRCTSMGDAAQHFELAERLMDVRGAQQLGSNVRRFFHGYR